MNIFPISEIPSPESIEYKVFNLVKTRLSEGFEGWLCSQIKYNYIVDLLYESILARP